MSRTVERLFSEGPLPPLVFLLLGLVTACNHRGYEAVGSPPAQWNNQKAEPADRLIVRDAQLSIVVPRPDTAAAALLDLARARGGYLVSGEDNRITVRIPVELLEPSLEELATWGRVRNRRLSGRDVTEAYYDYVTRLENAERSRQRYLSLLERAATVEETLAVERELERLNETIDLLKGQRGRLDELTRMATLTVDFEERVRLGPLGYLAKGLYEAVAWLFVRG